jgi:hypothetical protein
MARGSIALPQAEQNDPEPGAAILFAESSAGNAGADITGNDV